MLRSFDSSVWPDPAAMAVQVKKLTGAEMMVSLWPSVEDLSVNYVALQEQGLLAIERGGTGITDSFAGVYTRLSRSLVMLSLMSLAHLGSQSIQQTPLQESSYVRHPPIFRSFKQLTSSIGKQLNQSYFSNGIHNFWIDQADGTISLPPAPITT